jgi:hypothetical protein
LKDICDWLNFRWALDVQYTHVHNAPLLTELCRKYKRFWDGEFWHQIQAEKILLRWPDWRERYRIDLEKVRLHSKLSSQLTLEVLP